MSELSEALASLEKRIVAAIPTVEQVAAAAVEKLLPTIDSAVKGAISDAGPIGSMVGVVADPLIDDVDAYIQGLLTGVVPATTAPALTVDALAKKVAALTVATGATASHSLQVAASNVAKLPTPVPAEK